MIMNLLQGFTVQNYEVFTIEGAAAIVFYFTMYSLIGWLLENCYSFFTRREFFKENFLFGPFKPMYGFAPVLLVYLITPETSWVTMILLCFFIPTFVEYVSGAMLQKCFHKQWWDYSGTPMQLHGHICLPFSICWVFLSLVVVKWVHPEIASMYGAIESYWAWVWSAVGLYFLADLVLAVRRHSLQDYLTDEPTNPIQ